jgi:hypothetical protein
VSPLSLRRYRAERLLREEFEGLQAGVIASVRGRLRAIGVRVDLSDLEVCYGQAWQGLYSAVLDGEQIGPSRLVGHSHSSPAAGIRVKRLLPAVVVPDVEPGHDEGHYSSCRSLAAT